MLGTLYEKREATPGRSTLGCLVATLGLVGICGIYYASQQAVFVFGAPETGKAIVAQQGVQALERALNEVLAASGAPSFEALFTEEVRTDYPTVPTMLAKHAQLARGLLARGAGFSGLRAEYASKLQAAYLQVRNDPWERPYQVLFDPAEHLKDTPWWNGPAHAPLRQNRALVFSLGPDGMTDFGASAAPIGPSEDDVYALGAN
ncbi:MAG: hypothetical protein HYV27_05350 [Candidatus Hydrogenedentes bacterium]|nr:hypothetical protein [Candidatus Hydrogenedentota bacterium]